MKKRAAWNDTRDAWTIFSQHLHRHLRIRFRPAKIDQDRYARWRPGRLDCLQNTGDIRAEPAIGIAAGPGERHGIAYHLAHHIGCALRNLGGMRNDDDADIAGT